MHNDNTIFFMFPSTEAWQKGNGLLWVGDAGKTGDVLLVWHEGSQEEDQGVSGRPAQGIRTHGRDEGSSTSAQSPLVSW